MLEAALEQAVEGRAVTFYVDLLKKYGPPGAANGFNENLALFNGKCGMWIDATVAASFV
jgi:sorbitol/mannitol transport system substrate-binding protein